MKFDVARAMEWVDRFAFPRRARSEDECRAADILAARFQELGWRTQRSETRVGCRRSSLGLVVFLGSLLYGYALWRAIRLSFPGAGVTLRVVALAGIVALVVALAAAVAGRRGLRTLRDWIDTSRPERMRRAMVNLVASHPGQGEPRARVVILSHLDTATPEASLLGCVGTVLIVALLAYLHARFHPVLHLWEGPVFFLVLGLVAIRLALYRGRVYPGDNRTGLAVLAELAEALPARLHERLEVHLAAVGSNAPAQLGSFTLAFDLVRHWPAKPTLAINLDSPGLGSELIVHGRGDALDVASSAARDLWIPHRVARWPYRGLDHRPFLLCGIAGISLAGHRRAERIDPAGLASSAQLVTEIALRWARRAIEQDQPETLARSSQKPG
jgi:hypothetical protein